MQQTIAHVAEPKRLVLAWQAPDHMGNRFRWAVGIVDILGADCTFRYVQDDAEFRALNGNRDRGQLSALGFLGYPAFGTMRPVHSKGVLETFMRRLPPRSRPDFPAFLKLFGFPPDAQPSDYALLSYTGAKLPSDGFSLVDMLEPSVDTVDLIFEAAGTRHQPGISSVVCQAGSPVELVPEPENIHDPAAIKIMFAARCIGYANRLQARTIGYWISNRAIDAAIHRLNGRVDYPKVFVFLRVRPSRRSIAA